MTTWAGADISAADLALMAADKPIIAGIQSIKNFSTGRFTATTTGDIGDADITLSTAPFSRMADGFTNLRSSITGTDASLCAIFDFGTTMIDFDMISVFNHNLDSLGCTAMTTSISDTGLAASWTQVDTFNPSTTLTADRRFSRMTMLDTGATARRLTSVRYVRIGLTFGGAVAPLIGEVCFARRRQLSWKPENDGYDPTARVGNIERLTTDSGIKTNYVHHAGARPIDFGYTFNTAAQFADLVSFFGDTGWGAYPFLWIDEPTTAPNDVYLMMANDPGSFAMPYVNWSARKHRIEAVEQGPHFLSQANT